MTDGQESVLSRIRAAKKDGSRSLSFSYESIKTLPPEIGSLKHLKVLIVSHCGLRSLPPEITQLSRLERLALDHNQLHSLPDDLGSLSNLKSLNISGNHLGVLPEWLEHFINLEQLNATRCTLAEIPESVGKLSQLRDLSLGGNNLKTIPSHVSNLRNLESLNLGCNWLKELPEFISELSKLHTLTLGDTIFQEFDHGNGGSRSWEWTNKNNNRIASLPDSFVQLSNLTLLDLTSCDLEYLPDSMAELRNLQELYLHDNPRLGIPPEILGLRWSEKENPADEDEDEEEKESLPTPPADILNFYFAIKLEPTRPLSEAKVILVGQGTVGKTSLVKRLIDGDYDRYEKKTEGIEIRPWNVEIDGKTVALNVWDFGGQEIMHATHQFFLTKRSVYLLVLNSREGRKANRVDYWLRTIESFAAESPVIVVCNKADEQLMDLDWKGLKRKFPSIKSFVRDVSCQRPVGIDEVKRAICHEVSILEHFGDEVPETWFNVKDRLAEMKEQGMDYLPLKRYRQLCREHGIVGDSDQDSLVGFLNDLGTMLHYGRHSVLTDLNILNPEWVTNGVYSIINDPNFLRRRDGIVSFSELANILDAEKYPRPQQQFILAMMHKFELCFEFEGSQGEKFLLPDLLSEEEKDTGTWADTLAFQYRYDVLPGSIITRFIVRMHTYISKNTYWKGGVVLISEDKKNRALARSDEDEGIIFVFVDGQKASRRRFLEVIRADFRKIHSSPLRKGVEERVALPDNTEVTVRYEHLRFLGDEGVEEFIPEGATKRYNVKELLDGIEDPKDRRTRAFDWRAAADSKTSSADFDARDLKRNIASTWGVGLFWLFAFIVISVTVVAIMETVPWYAVPVALIAALLALSLIGILSAHQVGTLGQKGLVESLKEFYKSLPLLKRDSEP